MTDKRLTVKEVAREMRVSRRTVHRWLREGILTGERLPGRWDVSESALAEFRSARSNTAPVKTTRARKW